MSYEIRKAMPGDAKLVASFFKIACHDTCEECINKYVCNKKFFVNDDQAIDRRLKSSGTCIMLAIENDTAVGMSIYTANKFDKARHRAEVGWLIAKPYLRKGIASELLEKLIEQARKNGLIRLEAESSVNNEASLALAKKFGFVIEGTKIKALKIGDKYEDTYMLGLLL
jgi:RimJ/RimL family protein N-acetyltransferase